jgi:hypothetical protein
LQGLNLKGFICPAQYSKANQITFSGLRILVAGFVVNLPLFYGQLQQAKNNCTAELIKRITK